MMNENSINKIGFTCAYTPLMLIDAAGFAPYRIMPVGDWPDQAGQLLHDNLCPHIKKILDRAMDKDLPDLAGMIFMNSCDAMRRLAQAWKEVRPDDPVALIDLPATNDELSISFLAGEFSRLCQTLAHWRGCSVSKDDIELSGYRYNQISGLLKTIEGHIQSGKIAGGQAEMQKIYNRVVTEPAEQILKDLKKIQNTAESNAWPRNGVPVFLFGNVLPDPEVFKLFEDCGALIAGENFCTGSRIIGSIKIDGSEDVITGIVRGLFSKPPCARTLDSLEPGKIADTVKKDAEDCGAKGVIGHTVKFCDPYLDRLPIIRETLKKTGIPFLLLEGDLSLNSIGQHRTRIEAFIEMLR